MTKCSQNDKIPLCCNLYTLRLHYNAVLYNAHSIITRFPRGSKKCFQYKCVKMLADDRGIHNASCENRTPCVFPSQV